MGLVYSRFYEAPLRELYRRAPCKYGWCSRDDAHICASLTAVAASHWEENEALCLHLIENNFQSFLVVGNTCVYFFLLYTGLSLGVSLLTNSIFFFLSRRRHHPYYGSGHVPTLCAAVPPHRALFSAA